MGVIKPGKLFLTYKSWYCSSPTSPMSSTSTTQCLSTSAPPPSAQKRKAPPSKKMLRVATEMQKRMCPHQNSLSGPPSHTSSGFINLRSVNDHLEQLRFWHEVSKPKLSKEQIVWLMNMQLESTTTRVPLMPIDLHDAMKASGKDLGQNSLT